MVLSLETEDSAEDAVQKLERAKVSTEDVLRALVRWKSVDKAAVFFGAWADSDPLFGCDDEECFKAVPRLGLSTTDSPDGLVSNSTFHKAAKIIAAVVDDEDRACELANEIFEEDDDIDAGDFLMAGGWVYGVEE